MTERNDGAPYANPSDGTRQDWQQQGQPQGQQPQPDWQQQGQPQSPYGAPYPPPYGPPPGQAAAGPYGYGYGYGYVPQPPTNTLAILALVFAFVFAPAGIVLGTISLKQIKRTGEGGHGLALSGLICGIVFTAIFVVYLVIILVFVATIANNFPQQLPTPNTALSLICRF